MDLAALAEDERAAVERLLASSVGSALEAKRLLARAPEVLGVREGGDLRACVLTAPRDDGAVEIKALVVAPDQRQHGLGRSVVTTLHARGQRLVAEASEESVGFFRKCGFAVRSEGGTPYKRRYLCELSDHGV